MRSLEDVLKAAQESYASAEVYEQVENVPPGKYTANINKVTIKEMGTPLAWKVMWQFRIVDGKYAGNFAPAAFSSLEGDDIKWTKGILSTLGLMPVNAVEIPGCVLQAEGCTVDIEVVEKNGFVNTYIKKLVCMPGAIPVSGGTGAKATPGSIPF